MSLFGMGFTRRRSRASAQYLDAYINNASATSWNGPNIALGTPTGTSRIVAFVHLLDAVDVTSLVIAGVTMTSVRVETLDTSKVEMFMGVVPSASGSFSMTFSGSTRKQGLSVYRLNDLETETPFDVKSTSAMSGAMGVNLNIPAFGTAIGSGLARASGDFRIIDAMDSLMAAETGRSISVNNSGSNFSWTGLTEIDETSLGSAGSNSIRSMITASWGALPPPPPEGVVSVERIQNTSLFQNPGTSSHTWSTAPLGDPGEDRWVGVAITCRRVADTSNTVLNSASIAGIPATIVAQRPLNNGSGDRMGAVAFFWALVPAGVSTGNIVMSFNRDINQVCIHTFAIKSSSSGPIGVTSTSRARIQTLTRDVGEGDALIGIAGVSAAGGIPDLAPTWTAGLSDNLRTRRNDSNNIVVHQTAFETNLAVEVGRTLTSTASPSGDWLNAGAHEIVVVHFTPG